VLAASINSKSTTQVEKTKYEHQCDYLQEQTSQAKEKQG